MNSKWKEYKLGDIINFDPRESIQKGALSKKIAMEKLQPYSRKISGYELTEFKGGSKFRNGDTLLARITPCLENGKTAQVSILENNEIGFGSTEFIVLRERKDITDNNFIYYLSISPDFRNTAIKSMSGTSGRQRAQRDVLENYQINLPPLPEQKRIAEILSSLDDKIELNNKMNKNLEEMAQAIFKQWFVDFEFPDENGNPYKNSGGKMIQSELGEIPEGWSVGSLSDIADYLNGLALQKFRPTGEEFIPVIKIKELKNGISENSEKASPEIDKKYIIQDGDVLFSWSGSLEVVIWCGGTGALNQHLFKVTSKKYHKWFYYLWTKFYLEKFQHIAASKATTMGHIKREDLDKAKVLVPKREQLLNLNELFDPIIESVITNSIENQTLTKTRDALLPKLMSGELRV